MMHDKNPIHSKPSIEDMKKSGVYVLKNTINSECYIGSCVKFSNRLAGHKLDCNRGKGNRNLQEFIKEYGWSSIIFEVLEFVSDKDKIKEVEQKWIDDIGFENLWNLSPKTDSLKGTKMPDSHRKKSADRMKGNKYSVGYKHSKEKGEKCALYWKTHPDEKDLMIERNRESQKKIDRTNWKKGHIIEVCLNGEVIDNLYGAKQVHEKYPIGWVMISKLLVGKREEFKGYKLKYIGKFFKNDSIERIEYFKN